MDAEKKEFGKWWIWFLCLLVVSVVVVWLLSVGSVVTERIVFEQSYQKRSAIKESIAIHEAQLIEIERKLSDITLEAGVKKNLEAQAAAIRIRLSTERSK